MYIEYAIDKCRNLSKADDEFFLFLPKTYRQFPEIVI